MKVNINQLFRFAFLRCFHGLLLFNLLISFSFYSQTTINGSVSDNETREDLIGATVKIKGTTIGRNKCSRLKGGGCSIAWNLGTNV